MAEQSSAVTDLHRRLGYKPLNRTWAKLEILLGLGAAGAGCLLGTWGASRAPVMEYLGSIGAGWVLMVLGGYLALAGSRSHLYQSNNELTAYLADEIKELKDRVERNEHPR